LLFSKRVQNQDSAKRLIPCPHTDDQTHNHREEYHTFAVGHLAAGYLTGKATSKLLNVNVSIPLLFVVSTIPDIDLLIPVLQHRGPTHSLLIISLLFLPIFMVYGKRVTPYFSATILHSIGDYFIGGTVQLWWPSTIHWYGVGINAISLTAVLTEWTFFLTSLTLMLKANDVRILFQHHPTNLLLAIPLFTVLLPSLFSFPLSVPVALIIPHIILLAFFAIPILIDIEHILRHHLRFTSTST